MEKMAVDASEGLLDAGPFIGALFITDARYAEAFPLVEAARSGNIPAYTTSGILSEVYAALTWQQAQPIRTAQQAAKIVAALVTPPSRIRILPDNTAVALKTMDLAAAHNLTARRIHDARHAAALAAGVSAVYTLDVDDWKVFGTDGLFLVSTDKEQPRTQN